MRTSWRESLASETVKRWGYSKGETELLHVLTIKRVCYQNSCLNYYSHILALKSFLFAYLQCTCMWYAFVVIYHYIPFFKSSWSKSGHWSNIILQMQICMLLLKSYNCWYMYFILVLLCPLCVSPLLSYVHVHVLTYCIIWHGFVRKAYMVHSHQTAAHGLLHSFWILK